MSIKLSKILFFFLFVFTPLAFGTTEPWSYALMEGAVSFALVLFFVHTIKHKDDVYHVPGLLPLVLFLLYILFQCIPLPPAIVAWISPQAYDIHSTSSLLAGSDTWMPLTVHRKATLTEFFRCSAYTMFYILTVQLLKEKTMLQGTALTIVLFGGLLAFSSILQFYLTEDMALWFRHAPNNSIVVGPYANHNHYAGLMEMIFPVVLGLFLFYRPRISNTSLVKGIAEMMSQEKANIHILIGAAALLIVTSIFVSLSRGAMISTCLSLLFFTFLLLKRRISKSNTIMIIGLIMVTALSIGWFGWDQIFDRFAKLKKAQGVIYESRLDFWKDTTDIIGHYPLTGSGAGTFSNVYPLHRTIISDNFLTHAHNDYLELLAETGIIGFTLISAFLLSLFYKTYTVFSKRRDAFSIYLYMGCITGMISILFHSVVDFNLRIGANGLWFFFLAGIAVSAANTGIRKQSRKTRLVPVRSLVSKNCMLVTGTCMAAMMIVFNVSNLVGIFYYSNIRHYIISADTPPAILKKIERVAVLSSRFDPLQPEYVFSRANTAWFLKEFSRSKSHFIETIKLDPLNARHFARFGTFLARQGRHDKAETALEKAMKYDRTDPEYAFLYATWLVTNNRVQQGLRHLKTALEIDENYMDRVLTLMIVNGIEPDVIESAIPDTPGASIAFAKFLYDTGNTVEAIDKYMATLDLIEELIPRYGRDPKDYNREIQSYYFRIYSFFIKHRDIKNAMHVMETAEKKLPLSAHVKVTLGDLYFRQGILYKAIEKYDHALLIDPKNKRAAKMLSKINP